MGLFVGLSVRDVLEASVLNEVNNDFTEEPHTVNPLRS